MSARAVRITTSGTTNMSTNSCFVYGVLIACQVPGTGWSLQIQSHESPAKVLIPKFTLAALTDLKSLPWVEWQNPKEMRGGIDIVTAGTPGEVSVWLDYFESMQ